MRIHSRFKDYYDSAIGYGIDPAIHYVRREGGTYHQYLQHKLDGALLKRIEHSYRRHYDPQEPQLRAIAIGFCGRIYPCMQVRRNMDAKWEYLYSPDDLATWLAEDRLTMQTRNTMYWRELFQMGRVKDDLFIELNAPVFVVAVDDDMADYGANVRTNIQLKPLEFYRMVDPFTAFQEIAMYLGNVLVKRDEPLQVADRYRITQHGFDEWSFRTKRG